MFQSSLLVYPNAVLLFPYTLIFEDHIPNSLNIGYIGTQQTKELDCSE